MNSIKYVHRVDGEYWVGYLVDYPTYLTQGMSEV